jgi:chromosome segregation ATPase
MSDQSEQRTKLRDAIASVKHEEARLTALTEAQSRARDQLRHAQSKLTDATDKLNSAARDERSRLAYEFLNSDTITADPVSDAKLNVEASESEVLHLTNTEAGLSDEISRVQASLRDHRMTLWTAMSAVIIDSPEYQSLLEQHRLAWKQLRSIKVALGAISAGLHGQLPHRYADIVNVSEPLEDKILGFPVDKEFVATWADALAQLEVDADAALPSV